MKKYSCLKYGFEGKRLDKFLVDIFGGVSRAQLQKMIKAGKVKVNGVSKKSGYILLKNDVVEACDYKVEEKKIKKEKLNVPILYEDDSVLVVDKPCGMIVHPVDTSKSMSGTLVNAVFDKIKKGDFEGVRPGIVHRIDKDTSGLVVVAKNKEAYHDLVSQFKKRSVDKTYLALVVGILEHPEGIVESPIGRAVVDRKKMRVSHENDGKMAISIYRTLKIFKAFEGQYSFSFLEIKIKTGRTHQIRVHMSALGHPVVGDETYGNRKVNGFSKDKMALKRQFLHAHKLIFVSPDTKKEVSVKADLPLDLENVIKLLSL
ncbi:MAG: RluA family pseudouridine synthase [Candidatus Gracilibacteria bacterium]|nr:RluA family pseudouridine synthase [Candidatus Gracilibacteria bacterium]